MKVKALIWLGVKTPHFDAMTTLYRDVMGLDVFQADAASSRFRLQNGTEIHVYGPADEDHDFFSSGPVVGFLVDDVEGARAEMEAAGIMFIGDIQVSETHAWNHFRAPDGNVYEIMAEL
jgi:catechol 2,3-dioxygenase-like lactoylglutathione lyase family enzyme